MKPDCLVILGSSLTGLALIRDSYKLKIAPVLVDTFDEIAMSSRLAEKYLVSSTSNLIELFSKICTNKDTWLIATSDSWLQYIVENREQLETYFSRILHPSNSSIETCLDKHSFLKLCNRLGVLTPKLVNSKLIRSNSSAFKYPLLIRPITTPRNGKRLVPKAVEVNNREEATHWLDLYSKVGQDALITESLLDRSLEQLSVGISRDGKNICSFTALKRRPLPRMCSVGSYVESIIDPGADCLAKTIIEALDYQGIAEVEILKDKLSNEYFLIEVNARPWAQYSLGPALGFSFLNFLIDQGSCKNNHVQMHCGCWIDFTADAYCCLSRTIGHVRKGEVSWFSWFRELIRVRNFAYFRIYDPLPAWRNLLEFIKK